MSSTRSAMDRPAPNIETVVGDLATILAVGLLRLHSRSAISVEVPPPEVSPNSSPPRLEVPAETVLSVHTG
jgi:hypothetical protein